MLNAGDCICVISGIADDQMLQKITYYVTSQDPDNGVITANIISVEVIPPDFELFATAHKMFANFKDLMEDSKWNTDQMKSMKTVRIFSLIDENYNIVSLQSDFTKDINVLCSI